MAQRQHSYRVTLRWQGNRGVGTASYGAYGRAHQLLAEDHAPIDGSADPAFLGDPARWNPEQLLVAALSACHQLWYLHLCATAGIVVLAYADQAEGTMAETEDGGGQFTSVVLHPHAVLAAGSDVAAATALHHAAAEKCFIARSVNFPVTHAPRFTVG